MSEKIKGTRAHTRYYTGDGKIVPGATSVVALLNKPALVAWANKMGLEGIDTTKYVSATADIGTCCHLMVQSHLQNVEPDLSVFSPEAVNKAENGFLKFLEFEKENPLSPVLLEAPLVSEKHKFGGTIDFYGSRYRNKLARLYLMDFKTSGAIYPEMQYQVAAYWWLLEETGHPVDEVSILRIGRDETEGFEERRISMGEIERSWEVFKHLRAIYELVKKRRD